MSPIYVNTPQKHFNGYNFIIRFLIIQLLIKAIYRIRINILASRPLDSVVTRGAHKSAKHLEVRETRKVPTTPYLLETICNRYVNSVTHSNNVGNVTIGNPPLYYLMNVLVSSMIGAHRLNGCWSLMMV